MDPSIVIFITYTWYMYFMMIIGKEIMILNLCLSIDFASLDS